MATQVTLKAEHREGRGKGAARKLRADGQLPAVVYGGGGDPLAIALSTHDAVQLFHSISVDNTIVNLKVAGQAAPVATLVRDIQTHPARPEVLHVDFLRIQSGVKVELDVPVHLEGTPAGVRDGGILEQSIYQIPVRCVPKDIPEVFAVDVGELGIGEVIRIEDIAALGGVEVMLDLDRTVCTVQMPTELEVEEPEELEDAVAPEEEIEEVVE